MNAANTPANSEDSLGVTWGASYDFGVAKVYGMAQYGKNENKMGGYSVTDIKENQTGFAAVDGEGLEGYALTLGATAPVLGGTVYAQANYVDGETSADVTSTYATANKAVKTADFDRWGLSAAYSYPFSKRTMVYTFAAYSEGTLKVTGVVSGAVDKTKTKKGEFGLGLVHKF